LVNLTLKLLTTLLVPERDLNGLKEIQRREIPEVSIKEISEMTVVFNSFFDLWDVRSRQEVFNEF
jgi:hypothetical protein